MNFYISLSNYLFFSYMRKNKQIQIQNITRWKCCCFSWTIERDWITVYSTLLHMYLFFFSAAVLLIAREEKKHSKSHFFLPCVSFVRVCASERAAANTNTHGHFQPPVDFTSLIEWCGEVCLTVLICFFVCLFFHFVLFCFLHVDVHLICSSVLTTYSICLIFFIFGGSYW